jgi:hypothetical protein
LMSLKALKLSMSASLPREKRKNAGVDIGCNGESRASNHENGQIGDDPRHG